MNKYKLLNEVIQHLEEFESTNSNDDIKEFSIYLKDRLFSGAKPKKAHKDSFTVSEVINYQDIPEVEFSTLVGTMYRFARHYIKKALDNKMIHTIDEFGFMATLVEAGKLNKSDLINRHLMEISSGSEILRRLVKKGLIQEIQDKGDRRMILVELTEQGKKELFDTFAEMHKVSLIIKGNLSNDELSEMNFLLNKLKYFHWNIQEYDKNSNINELITKYV
ncbi:MAG: winged helix-turn-helix transcriptional regulator [Bacteroidales bacterium]|nr:winged helix-turn-helix transcriptional regulator [Bacteroidales bacterium]